LRSQWLGLRAEGFIFRTCWLLLRAATAIAAAGSALPLPMCAAPAHRQGDRRRHGTPGLGLDPLVHIARRARPCWHLCGRTPEGSRLAHKTAAARLWDRARSLTATASAVRGAVARPWRARVDC